MNKNIPISFSISSEKKDIIRFMDKLKEESKFSSYIVNLIEDDFKKKNNIKLLKKHIKEAKKDYEEKIKNIKIKIEENQKIADQTYKNTIDDLKKHYNGEQRLNVDKFMNFNCNLISSLTGEDFDKIMSKIVNEVSKWKKSNS